MVIKKNIFFIDLRIIIIIDNFINKRHVYLIIAKCYLKKIYIYIDVRRCIVHSITLGLILQLYGYSKPHIKIFNNITKWKIIYLSNNLNQ